MERVDIEEAALFLLHLRLQRQKARSLAAEHTPRSLDDAYAIQDATHDHAGWPIEVLKVGCTSKGAQDFLGIPHPIAGRVPAEGVFASGATVPRSFLAGAPLLECEFALRVDDAGAVDAVAPAVELVDSRFADTTKVSGPSIVADNSAGAGVVLGEATPIGDAGDLLTTGVALRLGDQVLASGTGAALDEGPHASVSWVLDHEAVRGRSVAGGTWIITGTCTGLTPTEWASSYTADFGPLGTVDVTLE